MRFTAVCIFGICGTVSVARADSDAIVQAFARDLQSGQLDKIVQRLDPALVVAAPGLPCRLPKTFKTDAERTALAECLTTLHFASMTEHFASEGGALLFRDGLALGATSKDNRIVRIGWLDTDAKDAAIPTVFRMADVIAAKIGKRDKKATTVWKSCIDAAGKQTSLRLLTASGNQDYDTEAKAAISGYTFAPVEIGGKATAACEVIKFESLDAAPPPTTRPMNVAPSVLEASRIAGTKTIVPDAPTKAAMVKAGKDKVVGSFKLCLDDKGHVFSTAQLKSTGFPAYDAKITKTLATWAYKPYEVNGTAVPVCTAVTFIFSVTVTSSKP